CSRACGSPAGIEPNSGMSTSRFRNFASGEVTRSERALPASDSMKPLRLNASRWSAAARELLKPKRAEISRNVGEESPARCTDWMKSSTWRCLLVNPVIDYSFEQYSPKFVKAHPNSSFDSNRRQAFPAIKER